MLPHTAVLEVTAHCNHKCFFCCCPWEYKNPKPKKELTTEEWKQVIAKYRPMGVMHITFTGGEATLRNDLCELIDYAYRLGYTVGLVSNGRAITDDLLHFLKKRNVLLSISVPGIETYKDCTGVDNLPHILKLFEKCRDLKINTVANIAVSKMNFNELYENIAIPILHGAGYILLNRFLPGGRGMENKEMLLSLDEINKMLDIAEEVLEKSGLNGHIGTELPYCIIKEPNRYKHIQIASTCGAAKGFFVTDPEGNIKVCNHSPHSICNWKDVGSLGENEYWLRFVSRDYRPKMCDDCKHKDICDGGCREAAHVFYGSIDACDPCFSCKK